MRRSLVAWASGLSFRAAARMVPHPEKAFKGGEDAWFAAGGPSGPVGDSRLVWGEDTCTMVGVFDGVGGWADSGTCSRPLWFMARVTLTVRPAVTGVDPGLYSKSLARQCAQLHVPAIKPADLLAQAYRASTAIVGTSTACVVSVDGEGAMRAATYGDSCFLLFRNGKLVHRQREMQQGFNCPMQMGTDAPFKANYAELWSGMVDAGDVIVLATDGVLDNVFDEEIRALVVANSASLTAAANAIAQSASKFALSPRDSPFTLNARKKGINHFNGGKLDDICVVCTRVTAD